MESIEQAIDATALARFRAELPSDPTNLPIYQHVKLTGQIGWDARNTLNAIADELEDLSTADALLTLKLVLLGSDLPISELIPVGLELTEELWVPAVALQLNADLMKWRPAGE